MSVVCVLLVRLAYGKCGKLNYRLNRGTISVSAFDSSQAASFHVFVVIVGCEGLRRLVTFCVLVTVDVIFFYNCICVFDLFRFIFDFFRFILRFISFVRTSTGSNLM